MQKKVTTCNNKLSKLQNSLDKLATDADREWSLEFLTKELEQLDNQYELSYKGFKTCLIEYDKSKTKEIDLKAKLKEDRKVRVSSQGLAYNEDEFHDIPSHDEAEKENVDDSEGAAWVLHGPLRTGHGPGVTRVPRVRPVKPTIPKGYAQSWEPVKLSTDIYS